MNISCGTDIIEISRIKESIDELQDKFINKIYTEKEIQYCESKKAVKYQHYAARFAAKEAIFKALSNILKDKYDMGWQNAEVLNDDKGKPYIHFIDREFGQIKSMDISISHCKEYAVANVVIVYENY